MTFRDIRTVFSKIAIVTISGVLAADVALGQSFYTLSTGSSVSWNTTLWTGGAGGVPPQTSTQVGLFNGGGTVTIDTTSTNTTPGGMLVGWAGGNADSFTVAVTSGTLTVGSTAGDGGGSYGLTLGETSGRTGTMDQSGGIVISPIVRANGGTGIYNLNSGTLQTQQVFNRAGAMTFNFGGGTLQATGTSSTGLTGSTATMVVNAGGGTVNNGGFATIMNAPISGTGNLTLTGGGTTTYTADNTHSGTTTLSAGTLRIGNSGTTGNLTGPLVNNSVVVFDRSNNATYTGVISGSGTVTKQGAGTLVLGPSNTYTGLTTVAAGVLQSGNNSPTPNGALSGGSYDVGTGAKLVFSRNIDNVRFASQSISGAGDVEFQGQAGGYYSFNAATYTGTLSYTGQTIVNLTTSTSAQWYQNTLWLEKDNVLPSATVVNLQSGKIYNRNQTGTGISVAGLTGSASTFITTDRDSLDVQKWTVTVASGSSFTYAGKIGSDGTGTGNDNLSFTKAGAGTQIFTGSNSYTGGTTITGGTLQIGAGGTVGQIVGNVTANAGLVFDRSDDIAFSGTISGNGSVTKRNATTLTLSAQSLPLTGSFTLASGSLRFTGTANTVTVSSLITGSGALVRDAASNTSGSFLILNGSNNYSGGTTINAGFVQLGTNDAIGTGPLTFTASTDRGSLNLMGFNQTVAGLTASNTTQFRGDIYNNQANALSTLTIDTPTGQTFTHANQIGALVGWSNIALVKAGAGTQILSGNNLFTGDTTITGGTLQIGAGGATGSIPGNAAVSSGATLAFNRSDAVTFSGTVSGAGGLVQAGGGTLTLSASNAFTGSTAVRAGVLDFSTIDALRNTSGVTIAGGATLRYSGGVAAFDRAITVTAGSGTGTVTNSGGGLLTLSGNISKDNSVLRLTGGAFNVTGTISGATPGTSDLIVDGTSTVTLSTVNTYNGPTFVNQSSNLVVGVNNAIPNNSVVTLGNATTTGTLTLGGNADAIGGLVFSGSGGTVRMAANQTASPQLSSTSALSLGSNASLDLSGMSTTDGLYRLISSTALSGSFGSVTGLSSNYLLRYGTVNANEVSAQRKAEFGTITATPAAATIITGGSTAFGYTVGNVTPSGGSTLSFTSANGANVAGSSSGTAGANATSASISGLIFTGTAVGLNQTGSFSLTDANAIGSPASGGVSVNVLDHATSSLAGTLLTSTTISLGRWNYQTSTWESGTSSGLFSIFNLASTFGASLTADLALLSVSGSGNGFTTNLNTYTDIAGGSSQQYSILVNPGSFLTSGTQSWTFTLGMSDKTNLSGATATNPLSVTATVIVVPEPGALALAGLGIAAAAWIRRRRA